ncbi:MAG: NAD(P)H-binding protein [Candidatus Melainabacteria bacterium]|jgi:NADH dehydrogenase|nr:NAD(P)H-binding protein [Candidatus Melainabacteria bacterium]
MSDILMQPKDLQSPFDLSQKGAIVVDGATGYLGNHLVAALAASGAEIRCLVHKGANNEDIQVLKKLGAKIFVGELTGNDAEVSSAFKDARVAVHLIGSIAPKKGTNHGLLHVVMTDCFIEKAKAAGVQSALMVTALGTKSDAVSTYHSTKYLAETSLLSSGLSSIILRPSLLVGRQVGRRNSKLVERLLKVIAEKKAVPLVNGGVNKLQPLFIGDMALAGVASIDRLLSGKPMQEPLELGGSEVLTMRDLVKQLMSVRAVNKPIVALPYPLAMAAAAVCQMVQDVPILSCDQVNLSMRDNICTDNRIEELLAAKPVPLNTALQVYSSNK